MMTERGYVESRTMPIPLPIVAILALVMLTLMWWNFHQRYDIEVWFQKASVGEPDLSLPSFRDAYRRARAGITDSQCEFLNSYWQIAHVEAKLGTDLGAIDSMATDLASVCTNPKYSWK